MMPGDNARRKATSPLQTERMLRSKGETCQICRMPTVVGQTDTQNPSVMCSGCNLAFHTSCGGISDNLYFCFIVSKCKPWYCYVCNLEHRDSLTSKFESFSKIEDVAHSVSSQVQTLSQEIQKIRSSESSWQQEFSSRLDEIDGSIENKVEAAITNRLAELTTNHATISNPAPSVSSNYRKNLVATCVPEVPGENVVTIVKRLAKQINFTQSGFIDNCFRVSKKDGRDTSDKPPTILIKFTTEISRDSFIKCYFTYIKRNQLTPSDIGLEGNSRIYVNEHLSPEIQPLLKKALSLRREGVLLQVASHCTYLSVKLSVNGRIIWRRIHNENDLLGLCDQ